MKSSATETGPTKILFNEAVIPQLTDVFCRTSCCFLNGGTGRSVSGDFFFTHEKLFFIPRQGQWMIAIPWGEIIRIQKINRSLEKGIEVSTANHVVQFTPVRERDSVVGYIKLMIEALHRENRTFGFNTKDDVEVLKRLTRLKAPHVFDDTVNASLQDIITLLKSPELFNEYFSLCGITDAVVSNWTKDKDGLMRSVQYTQRMFQSLNVSATHAIMKSGDSLAFEVLCKYTRPSAPDFLQMNLQLFFRQDGDTTSYRGAYALDYSTDTWDKEFVEASVNRQATILYHFLKSKISGEPFDEDLYSGQWRKHQPYVLVILALVVALLAMSILKRDANWYGYLFGSLLIVCFFYS